MALDYFDLEALRLQHPAWRLLRAKNAPLVASFLHRVFITPNQRVLAQSDLVEALNDTLYALRERLGGDAPPKPANEYLTTGRPTTPVGCASFTHPAQTSHTLT